MLSYGILDPDEVFALPEREGEPRFALLVETLTAGPPVVRQGSEVTWYEWYRTDDLIGWRLGISTDGVWAWFIAGD